MSNENQGFFEYLLENHRTNLSQLGYYNERQKQLLMDQYVANSEKFENKVKEMFSYELLETSEDSKLSSSREKQNHKVFMSDDADFVKPMSADFDDLWQSPDVSHIKNKKSTNSYLERKLSSSFSTIPDKLDAKDRFPVEYDDYSSIDIETKLANGSFLNVKSNNMQGASESSSLLETSLADQPGMVGDYPVGNESKQTMEEGKGNLRDMLASGKPENKNTNEFQTSAHLAEKLEVNKEINIPSWSEHLEAVVQTEEILQDSKIPPNCSVGIQTNHTETRFISVMKAELSNLLSKLNDTRFLLSIIRKHCKQSIQSVIDELRTKMINYAVFFENYDALRKLGISNTRPESCLETSPEAPPVAYPGLERRIAQEGNLKLAKVDDNALSKGASKVECSSTFFKNKIDSSRMSFCRITDLMLFGQPESYEKPANLSHVNEKLVSKWSELAFNSSSDFGSLTRPSNNDQKLNKNCKSPSETESEPILKSEDKSYRLYESIVDHFLNSKHHIKELVSSELNENHSMSMEEMNTKLAGLRKSLQLRNTKIERITRELEDKIQELNSIKKEFKHFLIEQDFRCCGFNSDQTFT